MADNKPKKLGRWAKKRQAKKKNKENPSYRKIGRIRLQDMFKKGVGTKRSIDKTKAKTDDKIYSKASFKTYKQQFKNYCNWLEKNYPTVHTFEEALGYVNDYLRYLIKENRSPYSISTTKSALAKTFGVSGTIFIATPPRTRADIKRSRGEVVRDRHISSEKEQKLARLTSATGLRRAEMTQIRAEDLFFKNGIPYLRVFRGTKGGKERIAEIVGKTESETRDIVKWIQSKKGRLVPKLSSNFDNHHYRSEYACRIYKKYARNIDKIPFKERYCMRKERAGETFDRVAMGIASKNLGHNRIVVIAQNYLYQM